MSRVKFLDTSDTELCEVECEIADDEISRYVGLSHTDSLEFGEGMLFLYQEEKDRSFVMRDMDFDIDIIFADADGVITEIHSAEVPDGNVGMRSLTRYEGTAQAVVEVPKGFCEEFNIRPEETKIRLEIDG